MTTEIYSCKEGQSLKQGKLDYSSDITTKEQAEGDAKRRCQRDPSLKKIVYYQVSPDGEFRSFYSYVNPRAAAAAAKSGRAGQKGDDQEEARPEADPVGAHQEVAGTVAHGRWGRSDV